MYLGANKLVCFLWEYVSIVSYCMEAEIKIQGDVLVKGPIPAACPPHEPGTDLVSLGAIVYLTVEGTWLRKVRVLTL